MNAAMGLLPREDELYYEFSFRKHCYKFERKDVGYICTTHEDKDTALQLMFDEVSKRVLENNGPTKNLP